jgi:hypothetical protein
MAVAYWAIEQSLWESPVWVDVESAVYNLEEKPNKMLQVAGHNILAKAVDSIRLQADKRHRGTFLVVSDMTSVIKPIAGQTEPSGVSVYPQTGSVQDTTSAR